MRAADGTGAQVDAQMINKCKVEMRGGELYNVVESLKEEDGKLYYELKKQNHTWENPFLCLYFLQQYCPCIKPNRLTEAKFFDPSSTNIYCGLRFGPRPDQQNLGQENRATTIVYSL